MGLTPDEEHAIKDARSGDGTFTVVCSCGQVLVGVGEVTIEDAMADHIETAGLAEEDWTDTDWVLGAVYAQIEELPTRDKLAVLEEALATVKAEETGH